MRAGWDEARNAGCGGPLSTGSQAICKVREKRHAWGQNGDTWYSDQRPSDSDIPVQIFHLADVSCTGTSECRP